MEQYSQSDPSSRHGNVEHSAHSHPTHITCEKDAHKLRLHKSEIQELREPLIPFVKTDEGGPMLTDEAIEHYQKGEFQIPHDEQILSNSLKANDWPRSIETTNETQIKPFEQHPHIPTSEQQSKSPSSFESPKLEALKQEVIAVTPVEIPSAVHEAVNAAALKMKSSGNASTATHPFIPLAEQIKQRLIQTEQSVAQKQEELKQESTPKVEQGRRNIFATAETIMMKLKGGKLGEFQEAMVYIRSYSKELNIVFTMVMAYIIGYLHIGLFVLSMIILLKLLTRSQLKKTVRQIETRDLMTALESRDAFNRIIGKHGVPPSWIHFPDLHKVAWLNQIIAKFWPYVNEGMIPLVKTKVKQAISEQPLPGPISSISLTTISLGTKPIRIEGIKVYDTASPIPGDEEVLFDVHINWTSQMKAELAVELKTANIITASISAVHFIGVMRVRLYPLQAYIPPIQNVAVSFLERPDISFKLKGAGVKITSIPGLSPLINRIVTEGLLKEVPLLPGQLSIPIEQSITESKGSREEGEPFSLLQVDVLGVDEVKAGRFGSMYFTCTLIPASTHESYLDDTSKHHVSDKVNSSPRARWIQPLYLFLTDPKLQSCRVEIIHKGILGESSLGFISLPLDKVEMEQAIWYELTGTPTGNTGKVQIQFHMKQLAPALSEQDTDTNEFTKSNIPAVEYLDTTTPSVISMIQEMISAPVSTPPVGCLIVRVIRANDLLPVNVNSISADPYITAYVGAQRLQTKYQVHTLNPVFNWTLPFRVHNVYRDVLYVQLREHDHSKRNKHVVLGDIAIPVSSVLLSAGHEISSDWKLFHGGGTITLQLTFRPLLAHSADEQTNSKHEPSKLQLPPESKSAPEHAPVCSASSSSSASVNVLPPINAADSVPVSIPLPLPIPISIPVAIPKIVKQNDEANR